MMRIRVLGVVLAAAFVAGCDTDSSQGDRTIGDRGAGSAAPGNAGGGTFSTNDTNVPAQNLDPTHGSPDAQGTTGSASVTSHAPAAGAKSGH